MTEEGVRLDLSTFLLNCDHKCQFSHLKLRKAGLGDPSGPLEPNSVQS